MKYIREELNKIWEIEETSKSKKKEYHLQYRRPSGNVELIEEIVEVATSYYRDLFNFEPRP
jgi:hypothetical protein